ncbi:ISAzo13 family transposase [Streptomyces sp. TRM68367]|nr:ISAzo13 family transposase [Streptomyces sp. TRM68367]
MAAYRAFGSVVKSDLRFYVPSGALDLFPSGQPVKVLDHDFPTHASGTAIPYGIHDVGRNTGYVGLGTDHDTAAFAVACLRRWWTEEGRAASPDAKQLLITADGDGSNSSRAKAWKANLAVLATETGLAISMCHLPPGTSKWNRVEHRLFSFISLNWRRPPADQLRDRAEPDLFDHYPHRTGRHRPPGHRQLPHRNRDQRTARSRPHAPPRGLPRRVEPHHPAPTRRPRRSPPPARPQIPPPPRTHLRRDPGHPPPS